jgi:hypothetical protein
MNIGSIAGCRCDPLSEHARAIRAAGQAAEPGAEFGARGEGPLLAESTPTQMSAFPRCRGTPANPRPAADGQRGRTTLSRQSTYWNGCRKAVAGGCLLPTFGLFGSAAAVRREREVAIDIRTQTPGWEGTCFAGHSTARPNLLLDIQASNRPASYIALGHRQRQWLIAGVSRSGLHRASKLLTPPPGLVSRRSSRRPSRRRPP